MHNRVTTVVLSIVAFAATTGLVIAAGEHRTNSSSANERSVAKQVASPSSLRAPSSPWIGVDRTMDKPAIRLAPRNPAPKPARISRPTSASGSRLSVKFVDALKLRLLPNGTLMSLSGSDTTELNDLLDQHGVILERATNVPEARIQALINRAELNSGKAQPDIGGMYYVTGFRRDVDSAAQMLLRHDLVEWAQFQAMDDYTSNLVSLAEAPPAAPVLPKVKPLAPVLSTPAAQSKEDLGEEAFGPVGSCCLYQFQANRTYDNSCLDNITPAVCASLSAVDTFAFWNAEPNCAIVNCEIRRVGACCIPGIDIDNCLNLPQAECNTFGGNYIGGQWVGGETLACENANLPGFPDYCPDQTLGACCMTLLAPPNNCSEVASAAECAAFPDTNGPVWQGLGTTCASGICDPPPAEKGACCFADSTLGLVPLSSTVLNTSGGLGCFANDTAPCIGDGDEPYPYGPNNPPMMKWCEIVESDGVLGSPNFITAEENCNNLGGEYTANDYFCEECTPYGACCDDGECEYEYLPDCQDSTSFAEGRFFVQAKVEPANLQLTYWPTGGASGNGGNYGPTQRFIDLHFEDTIDLSVGDIPWPGDGSCPTGPYDSFADNLIANFLQTVVPAADGGQWTGFLGFFNLDASDTVVTTPIAPIGINPGTYNAGQPHITEAYAIACNGSMYCGYSYCTPVCYGPFSNSNGSYNGCGIAGDPASPISCSPSGIFPMGQFAPFIGEYIPVTRCASQLPWFCGTGELDQFGQVIPIRPPSACTAFYNPWIDDPTEDIGLLCQDALDTPLQPEDCGSDETLRENRLHGNCYWDRSIYPTYMNDYINLGDPYPNVIYATPWGAFPECYNGPFCDNYLCCEDVCVVNASCCEYTYFPYLAMWDGECATIARLIDLGFYGKQGLFNCQEFDDSTFPEIPGLTVPFSVSCGMNLAVNNQCISPYTDLEPYFDVPSTDLDPLVGGCRDLECCSRVCQINPLCCGFDVFTGEGWTEDCVELARQTCYFTVPVNPGTPDFTPLQFHLIGDEIGDGTAQNRVPISYQPLIPSPFFVHDQEYETTYQSLSGVLTFPMNEILAAERGLPEPYPIGHQLPPGDPYVRSRWQGPGLQLQQAADFAPSTGLYSWGEFLADISKGQHPHGDHVNGTKGRGVKVAVLDLSAWIQQYVDFEGNIQGARHEDLMNVKLEGRDTPHPPVKMIFDPYATRPQRGTAVLGIIAAEENGFGVTGIAPQCEPYFFPMVDADLGFREVTAWVNAIDAMSAGDIILATYMTSYYQIGCESSCLLTDLQSNALMGLATDAGIIVVIPAGDFSCDIDAIIGGLDSNDVITVGGAMPNPWAQRYWTSNFTTTQVTFPYTGSGITCSSWGQVVTTGGNLNLTTAAISTTPDTPGGDPLGYFSLDQKSRSYTNDFGNNEIDGGSVAASAMVAGSIACIQGLSLQRYGQGQPPSVMQGFPHTEGSPVEIIITTNYNSEPWADPDPPYTFDYNQVDGESWSPQRLIRPERMGVALITNADYALDVSGFITDLKLIRGDWRGGTISSLRNVDTNYYQATSRFTNTGSYNPPFYVPGAPYYSSVGNYVDMMVEFTVPASQPIGNQINASVQMVEPPVDATIEMHSWNWTTSKWQFMGIFVTTDDPGDEGYVFTNFASTANEIRNDEGKIYMRVVIQSAGNSGGNDGPSLGYLIQFDQVSLEFIPGYGGGGPPG